MKRLSFSVVFALGLLATSGARAGLFDDDEARKQIADLRNAQQQTVDRLNKLESVINNQKILTLLNSLEQQNAEIAKLRGQIEVLQYQLQEQDKRQKDLYLDTDTRLRRIEEGGVAAAPAAASATPSAPADPQAENAAYDAAFGKFRAGDYAGSITGFSAFLKQYSGSKLAPNAQYWIGNAYTAQRDYKRAIAEQQKLVNNYPDSSKVPDAMLNIATSQQELGDAAAAKKTLQDLVARFPLTNAAETAKKRLATMK